MFFVNFLGVHGYGYSEVGWLVVCGVRWLMIWGFMGEILLGLGWG